MEMKNVLLSLTIFIVIVPFKLFAQKENTTKKEIVSGIYKIDRIKRIKDLYLIYISNDDKKLEIISPKGTKPIYSCKIRKGKHYELILVPYFEKNDYSRFRVKAIEIKGILIQLDSNFDYNLYSTPCLFGLYYSCPKNKLE